MKLSSLYAYSEFGVLSTAWLPVMAAARAVSAGDPTHRLSGRTLRGLARVVARASMTWDFDVEGEPPRERRPFVVVSNHASAADPLLLSFLPFDMRFVAKEELFRAPLVGWHLRLAGDIPVRRGDRGSGGAMVTACVDTLRRGLSVMIFPEGTRSRTGLLGRFRDGAFRVAAAAGAAILPVALHGTARCIDAAGPQRAHATAQILAPIESAGLDVRTLRDRTRAAIASALADRATPVIEDYFLDGPVPGA
jgi:1-acyl-sn-glycerol-3-phosphate acyltransferase